VAHGDPLKLIGRTIAEKYAVESVVGEGGFATVYKAMHIIWKRPVALKVFKAFGDFSEENRQKLLEEFIQEGALLADLSARTAAIVQARDIGMLDGEGASGVPFMVLEWLEGATLEAALADEKARGLPLRTAAEAVQLLDPAAEALALAHRKGVAHRDIKPANIFVIGDARGEATVKLLDFGIAKVVSDAQKMAGTFTKTSGHVTSFTPAYGAPEQFSRTHGATGPWTDVFSLALIVVEMVTGCEGLQGDDFIQLAYSSANPERRPTPRTLGATVSDSVEAVVAKALSVKPVDRWQTAGDFWNALRLAVAMAPMRGMTDTSPQSGAAFSGLPRGPTSPGAPASAHTVAANGEPSPMATAPSVSRSAVDASKPSSKAGLFVALGLGAIVAIGGGLYLHGAGGAAPVSAPAAPTAAAVASTLASAPGAPAGSVASASPAVVTPLTCPQGMIAIPGGSFFMGSDEGLPFEKPAHQVTIKPFCIDEFEVSVDRYRACSEGGRCKRAGTTNEWATITEKERKAFDPLCNIREPEERAKHPVNCVDWEMSQKFCREQGGRLPTEAEWEFAARGPDGRKYPWGDDDPAADHLNACGKECVAWGQKHGIEEKGMYDVDDGFPNTAPVGSFPKGASRYGVQDVVGNVWEWVADWYGDYSKDEQTAPTGPESGDEKVIRGGAWNGSYASWVRPTFRYKDAPTKRSYGIGFRCAK
jgi:formylglycine-generating enzyme required for sulfatase activity/serine/threonine protein kinase